MAYLRQTVQPQGYNQGQQLVHSSGSMFRTVQPSLPAPAAAPYTEVHSNMAGALAGAPSIRLCDVCKQPFADSRLNRYCSLQCYQQASQPSTQSSTLQPQQSLQRYPKKCEFCSRLVTSPLSVVPDRLQQFRSFASAVCSVNCLEKFLLFAENSPWSRKPCGVRLNVKAAA